MYAELTRSCKRCGLIKSLDNFYTKLNKEARCKQCVSQIRKEMYEKNTIKIRERVKKYRHENPKKIKDCKLKQTYGITLEEYNQKYEEQDGSCAVCKKSESVIWKGKLTKLAVDHNHKTGQIRGLLCCKCNRALGLLEENPSYVQELIIYMEKYQKLG